MEKKKINQRYSITTGYWEKNIFISKIYDDNFEYNGDGFTYKGQHIVIQGMKMPHRKGEIMYSNSDVYIGEVQLGKVHGKGEYTSANGDRFIGNFANNKKEGPGKEFHKDGLIFECDYVNNLAHGEGRITHKDGRTITGTWYQGKKQ